MTFGIGGNILTGAEVAADLLPEIGSAILNRAVNNTLYVSPNGDNTDGLSWATAYQALQGGLDAASVDPNIATLIAVAPHPTYYDIDRAGDPTWAANVILHGTHRTWAKIMNTHVGATSIMAFTGKASVINFNLNLGTANNGLIMTHDGARAYRNQFVGEDLTQDATALTIVGDPTIEHAKIEECYFHGNGITGNMTGLLVNNHTLGAFLGLRAHDCKTAIQVVGTQSDDNLFRDIDIGSCGIGFDLDEGNGQHIEDVLFHDNTLNIDDEVGDHFFNDIWGNFAETFLPDNFAGVTLSVIGAGNTWCADTQILSAASRLTPFRITGISIETDAAEKYRVRLTADDSATYFMDIQFEEAANKTKREALMLPTGSLPIFNYNTEIKGSAKSESGGNVALVWLEIQEL